MMIFDQNARILIVDDYKTLLRMVRTLLRQLGFDQVDEAMDGAAALEKARRNGYDLIICDCTMAPMSGYDLVKAVRADSRLEDTPVLLVTADSRPDTIRAAHAAGGSGYIVKPFSAATLKTKLTALLGDI